MTNYSVPAGTSSFSQTLTASAADQVTFADRAGYVTVTNTGTTVLYARADGITAVAAAQGTVAVVPNAAVVLANGEPTWYQSSKAVAKGSAQIPNGGGAPTTSPTNAIPNPGQPGLTQPYMSSGAGQANNPGTVVSLISSAADTYTVALAG